MTKRGHGFALALVLIVGCTTPLERGERLYREGDLRGALRVWRAVSETDASHQAVNERLQTVEQEFARLLRRYEKQAAFFESESRLGEAVLYYRLAYKLDPTRQEILAHVQDLVRDLDRRVRREREKLKSSLATGDLPRAYRHARRLERLDPFDPENQIEARQVRRAVEKEEQRRLRAGKYAYAAGDRAGAQRSFERVLDLDPWNETARGYLSYLRKLEDAPSRAQATPSVPSAISEEQAVAEGHLRSGQDAEASGELFRALAEYDAALRVDPKHGAARRARDQLRARLEPQIPWLYEEGKRYFQDEDLHNALRVWRNVLLIDPDDARTRENVDRAERLLARLEEIQTGASP
jgi:tetratricopeptide (TPR) repeat protein